jgi:hypothetical protein
MYKNKIKYFLLVGLTPFLAACIYETDQVYENPVITNPTPPNIIDLYNNLNIDTIWVYGDYDIKYHFQSSNETQRILGLRVIIDDNESTTQSSSNGKFSFKQAALAEGVHQLAVEVFTKSGTGSIADKVQMEGFQFRREWIVVADYSSKSVEYTIDNGYLKLSWEPYKNNDLKTYRIQNTYSVNYWIQNTLSANNPSFIDSLYAGMADRYTISVEKTNGERIPWGSVKVGPITLEPQFFVTDDNKYYFVWRKSPLRINTNYKFILYNFDDYNHATRVFGVNDTVFMSSLYFGDRFRLDLWALPEAEADERLYPAAQLGGYAGIPVKMKEYTTYTSPDSLTAFDNCYVYNYSMDGLHETAMPILSGNTFICDWLQASPRGRFLIGKTSATIGTTGISYFAKNLTTGQVYHMNFVDSVFYWLTRSYSTLISDNGLGIFQSSTKEFLFDFPNNVELASRSFIQADYFPNPINTPYNYFTKISPDGRYYFSYMKINLKGPETLILYKRNGSNLEKVIDLDSKTTYWDFNPIEPGNYVIVKDNKLSFYQCEPHLLLNTVTFSIGESFNNIDFIAREVLTTTSNQFVIRDLMSGLVIKRLPKQPRSSRFYRLHNHRIIYSNYILKTQ